VNRPAVEILNWPSARSRLPAAALDLADALGTSSKVRMNLQAIWDLVQAARRRARVETGSRLRAQAYRLAVGRPFRVA
jgi:plasmid maintenance system antidote protein VapI